MKKTILVLSILFASITMFSCAQVEAYDIYVTVYPMKYVVEEIFEGTDYTVGIVPGVTSHENSVDWSPKEIIAMTDATYLFYVGANYDYYIDAQIESIFTDEDVELIKVEEQTSYITFIPGIIHSHECEDIEEELHTPDTTALGIDPHFWISPLKVMQVSALIYDKIILKFEDTYGLMEQNYNDLLVKLQDLNDEFSTVLSNATQIAMTSTNIYGYLRSDYGYEYVSISPGYHEETEQFTSQQKEEIVNIAIEHNIKYIIYEMYTSSPLSNAVYNELELLDMNPQKLEFQILQSLSNEDISAGKDYVSVMYENLELLKTAVGYQAE